MGLLRSLWQLTTIVVAGPLALVGVLTLAEGRYGAGAFFVGLAVSFALLSEVMYLRATGGTVDRLRRLIPGRGDDDPRG